MPWALFAYGRSKPPKAPLRRVLWACAVLLFCGALLPLVVVGVVEQWASGEILGGLTMTWLAGLLAFGAGAAVYALVRMVRERRGGTGSVSSKG